MKKPLASGRLARFDRQSNELETSSADAAEQKHTTYQNRPSTRQIRLTRSFPQAITASKIPPQLPSVIFLHSDLIIDR